MDGLNWILLVVGAVCVGGTCLVLVLLSLEAMIQAYREGRPL
jgi:hypothetical protein